MMDDESHMLFIFTNNVSKRLTKNISAHAQNDSSVRRIVG